MASNEVSTQSVVPLIWEEHELFPPLDLESFSEGENESSDISIFVSDHDVLDCPICYEPLKPPIFECVVGHVCCSSCCGRLNEKCHTCRLRTGFRCMVVENFVRSTRVACTNKRYGCNVIMTYYEVMEHEKTCFHLPFYCSYPNCFSSGSKRSFRKHMRTVHKERIIDFQYDRHLKVVLPKACTYKVLAEQDNVFYLHKNDEGFRGVQYSLSIVSMRASHLNVQFWYEIKVSQFVKSSEDGYLQLRSKVEKYMAPKGYIKRSKFSLLVPSEYCRPNGDIHVFVCIKKIQSNDTSFQGC